MTVEYLRNLKFSKCPIFYLFRFFLFLILTFFHHHHGDIFNIFHLLHVGRYLWFIRNVNNFNRFSVCLKIQDLHESKPSQLQKAIAIKIEIKVLHNIANNPQYTCLYCS